MAEDKDIIIPNATAVLKPFKVIDPFNNNEVEGFVHWEATQMYGALEIEKVNGKDARQTIWATPKMRYPFSSNERTIVAIPKHRTIQIYEKVDGTNIFAFVYHDGSGKEFVSYKTRLMAFLKFEPHTYGDFRGMWCEILERYPTIPDLVRKYRGISFELYGKKNPILIQYDESLMTAVLFAVPGPGKIISPKGLDTGDVPKANLIREFTANSVKDFEKAYWDVRDWLNTNLKIREEVGKSSDGEDIVRKVFSGIEGSVWYSVDENDTIMEGVQFKCKPDEIFDICTQGSVPLHSIQITIRNALEQDEPLTFELIKRMLMEEFSEDRIYAKSITIQREIDRVVLEQKLLNEIAPEYIDKGFDIDKDKGTVMRHFGPRYPKNQASKIYTLLLRHFGTRKGD